MKPQLEVKTVMITAPPCFSTSEQIGKPITMPVLPWERQQ